MQRGGQRLVGRGILPVLGPLVIRLYVDHVGERSRRMQAYLTISLALMFSEVGKPITIFVQQGIKFRSRVQTVLIWITFLRT